MQKYPLLLSFSTVIAASVPVEFSTAETCRMPLESMSKVTSICGTPFSTCGSPVRMKEASLLLSYVPSIALLYLRQLPLALEHLHLHFLLEVHVRGESLRASRGDLLVTPRLGLQCCCAE